MLQSTVSLRSGESESYPVMQGGAAGFGLPSLLADLRMTVLVRLANDSIAVWRPFSGFGENKV